MRGMFRIALVALAITACASSPKADEAATQRPSRPTRRSNVLITREELASSSARDAFQAVQVLRPDWLRGRGAVTIQGSAPDLLVYLDGQRIGGRNTLAQFPVIGIKEMRFYGATDATQRWGTGHAGGVIEVVTR